MKNFKYIFIIFAIAVSLVNCTPDPIDIDVQPAQERLVIASQVLPNSIMVIGLTRSFSPLDPDGHADTLQNDFLDRILVADAIVTVTHPSGTDTLYMLTPGIYASVNVLLVDYGSYTVHAKDPSTGLEVTATTELLPGVSFDSVQPFKQLVDGDTVPFIHYELTDYGAAADYYVVCFYRKSQDTSAFDLNNYFNRGSNQLNRFDLITDQDFNENGKLVRNTQLSSVSNTDTIAVTVSHITKGYYEFLSAYKRSSSLFNQLSGEPINYPTNVEGGYGYFNTHFPEVRIFDLGQF